ncbi:MAG: hypothetical protein HY717_16785 [Planctomycetes bacterium]|nr:hypothetical protein [Planctomycetota bacterium]
MRRFSVRHSSAFAVLATGIWLVSGLSARSHELVDYRAEIQPIFDAGCGGSGCHLGERASGVELTTYDALMASFGELYQAPPVIAGKSGMSSLYLKLIGDPPLYGSRMPFAAPLDPAQIGTLRRWIDEGARGSTPALERGDVDGNGQLEVTDGIGLLGYLFLGGAAPSCLAVADANADGSVDLSDAVGILLHLFLGTVQIPALGHEERDQCLGATPELSFESIQAKIFATTCSSSSCHSALAHKGGLVLESLETAHAALVGQSPENIAAREAGLLRVDAGRPENSFLLKKLVQPGPGEGNRMPLSLRALSEDRIQAIREWILAGAPRQGAIAGVPDLSDTPPPPPDRLQPPPVPENGLQIHLDPFQIAAHREREVFKFYDPELTFDAYVQQIDVHMTENSHHFILYTWDDHGALPPAGLREGSSSTGVGSGEHSFITGAQQSFFSQKFSEDGSIAFLLPKGTIFDLNSHYLNLDGSQVYYGEVYVNIFFADPAKVASLAKPIFAIDPFLYIPPGETRTSTADWPGANGVARPTWVHSLSSHMHRHGERFTIKRFVKGSPTMEVVYDNFDWDDPENKIFDPPMVLTAGEGLRFECVHNNFDKTRPLTFGLTSEDEMCIMLGYYSEH